MKKLNKKFQNITKISPENLLELSLLNGGKFAVSTVNSAFDFCKKIAKGHYENFPVGSIFVPKKIRKHFYSIYAFARIADDLGDELISFPKAETAEILNNYKRCLLKIFTKSEEISNPIFLALQATVSEFRIPLAPFQKLLTAFKSDVNFQQPLDFNELFAYCNNSANPIGELILRLFGEYNEKNLYFSNKICTALQLINFWQDFSVDINRGRFYIPKSILDENDLNFVKIEELLAEKNKNKVEKMLQQLYEVTENTMSCGLQLIKEVKSFRLRFELKFIVFGGKFILKKTKKLGTNIFTVRPQIF